MSGGEVVLRAVPQFVGLQQSDGVSREDPKSGGIDQGSTSSELDAMSPLECFSDAILPFL